MPTRSVVFLIVLTHWNNSILVEMSLHSETSFWFRSQPFFVHACLEEKQQIPGLAWPGIRTSIYHTRDMHSNHYTTEVVLEPLFLTMNFYNIPQNDLYLTNGSNKKKYDSGLYQCNGTIFINLSFWTSSQNKSGKEFSPYIHLIVNIENTIHLNMKCTFKIFFPLYLDKWSILSMTLNFNFDQSL